MTSASLVTRNLADLVGQTDNIYQSIAVIATRAKQIAVAEKEELNAKLAEFASTVDNLEEVFENREQIEISRFYEKQPKPTTVATEEFLDNKVMFRNRDEDLEDIPEL